MTLCIPLCICRLTLAWISSEISTKLQGMLTHLDRSSLTAAGLYLMPIGVLCCTVSTAILRLPSQLPSVGSFFQLSTGVPLPTSGRVEISSPKPFVWFRAKTDKWIVCLANHLHSVTLLHIYIERERVILRQTISLYHKSSRYLTAHLPGDLYFLRNHNTLCISFRLFSLCVTWYWSVQFV